MLTTTHPSRTIRHSRTVPSRLASVTWQEFRERHRDECLAFQAQSTQSKVVGILDSLQRFAKPRLLAHLTAGAISKWQAWRKSEDGAADTTIKGNLAHLRSALAWAVEQGMLGEVPKISAPIRAKSQKLMKGRPVTQAEFDKMLACCETPDAVFFLKGLWYSGLRLAEALALSWDAGALSIDMTGEFPMFRIPAEHDKANTDRLLPMSPEFDRFIAGVPEAERTGHVFKGIPESDYEASRLVSAIGEKAGVVVDAKSGKFASAHDLRRSFGERWAARVMPADLMQWMRHENIDTTLRFYVGQNSQEVARRGWEAAKQEVNAKAERLKLYLQLKAEFEKEAA